MNDNVNPLWTCQAALIFNEPKFLFRTFGFLGTWATLLEGCLRWSVAARAHTHFGLDISVIMVHKSNGTTEAFNL
jgi:hypothetical protein